MRCLQGDSCFSFSRGKETRRWTRIAARWYSVVRKERTLAQEVNNNNKVTHLLHGFFYFSDVLQYLKQLLQPKKEAPAARKGIQAKDCVFTFRMNSWICVVPLIKAPVTRAKGPSFEDVPNSSIRSVIAKRLTQAKVVERHALGEYILFLSSASS